MSSSNANINQGISPIEELIADYRDGKMVILVDDENRENEGDLLLASDVVSAEHINFMAAHGRGLICLTLTETHCQQLNLPLMVSRNNARYATNFTVSIEAAEGVTTGISAHDRAHTVRAACAADAAPTDIVTPGHIFPIKAQPGGVLTRAGHTEAGVDLARLAGFSPSSVICEILNDDGTMARLDDLRGFAAKHDIKLGTIADLIAYRLANEPTVVPVTRGELKLKQGSFGATLYKDTVEGGQHLALVHGNVRDNAVIPVRVQVHRGIIDLFQQADETTSQWLLDDVLDTLAKLPAGVVILIAYADDEMALHQALVPEAVKADNVKSNSEGDALRMLGAGGQILADLGVHRILALGSEKRAYGLSGFGVEIVEYISDLSTLATYSDQSS